MTFLQTTMSERKLVRVQEKGQVTLPTEIRKKLDLKKGDLVAVMEAEDGVFISPQEIVATKALDRIGELLKAKGVSLDEMIESGRKERGNIIKKKYDLQSNKN